MSSDFDWVNEYAKCSVAGVFEKLKIQLQEDVEKRNALRGDQRYYKFSIVINGDRIGVVVEGHQIRDSVLFHATSRAIEVMNSNGKMRFEAMPTLNDDGECRLRVRGPEVEDGRELDLWQMRKIALATLFFHSF